MPYVLGGLFLIAGAVFILLGCANLLYDKRKRATWIPVEGTVVDFTVGSDHSDSPRVKEATLYAPVYRYALEGTTYTATSKVSSSSPRYKAGDTIRILVNPSCPDESDETDGGAPATLLLLGFGAVALALGAVVTWFAFAGRLR